MARKEVYEEPDSEEYDDEEQNFELPDVDDDEDLKAAGNDEQEAMKKLAAVKARGNNKAYMKLRQVVCRKYPDLALCRTDRYEDPFMPTEKATEQ